MTKCFVETCYRRPYDPFPLPQGVLFYRTSVLLVGDPPILQICDDARDLETRRKEIEIINRHGGKNGGLSTESREVYEATVQELNQNECPNNTE